MVECSPCVYKKCPGATETASILHGWYCTKMVLYHKDTFNSIVTHMQLLSSAYSQGNREKEKMWVIQIVMCFQKSLDSLTWMLGWWWGLLQSQRNDREEAVEWSHRDLADLWRRKRKSSRQRDRERESIELSRVLEVKNVFQNLCKTDFSDYCINIARQNYHELTSLLNNGICFCNTGISTL